MASDIAQKRKSNARLSISRLPNEILSQIFLVYRESTLLAKNSISAKVWIHITHVCHEWRLVAIGNSQFWSVVELNPQDLELAAEMINRSKSYPLSLNVGIFTKNDIDEDRVLGVMGIMNTQVKSNFSRIKDLRIRRVTPLQLRTFFDRRLNSSQLEDLRLACLPLQDPHGIPSFFLDDGVINAPSLRRLSVVCCEVDWNSRIFNNLTHLRIVFPPESGRFTMFRFLNTISQMCHLQSLTFRGFVMRQANDLLQEFERNKIDLATLQDLDLAFDMDHLANFLRCVNIPNSKSMKLLSYWDRQTEDPCENYDQIIELLRKHFKKYPNRHNIKALRMSKAEEKAFQIQGFYDVLTHAEMNVHDLRPPLDFTFCWQPEQEDNGDLANFDLMSEGLVALITSLPLSNLVTLEFSGDVEVDHMFWGTIFGPIPTLRSILLDCVQSRPFFVALNALALLTQRMNLPPEFIGLETVIVQNSGICTTHLFEALEMREQIGMPLKRVSLLSVPSGPHQSIMGGCNIGFGQYMFHVTFMMNEVAKDIDDVDDRMIALSQ